MIAAREAEDDSAIVAVVMVRGARTVTWTAPEAADDPRAAQWCRTALTEGQRVAVLTRDDLLLIAQADAA